MSITAWRRRPDVLWRQSLATVIFLPEGAQVPITLAGSGPAVWELLAEPRSLDDLVTVLASAYDADADVVRGDVEPVLDQLVAAGAVERIER